MMPPPGMAPPPPPPPGMTLPPVSYMSTFFFTFLLQKNEHQITISCSLITVHWIIGHVASPRNGNASWNDGPTWYGSSEFLCINLLLVFCVPLLTTNPFLKMILPTPTQIQATPTSPRNDGSSWYGYTSWNGSTWHGSTGEF